jgi:hypothetical protein
MNERTKAICATGLTSIPADERLLIALRMISVQVNNRSKVFEARGILRMESGVYLEASLIISGCGEPIKDAAVVIHDDKIDQVGPQIKDSSQIQRHPIRSSVLPDTWTLGLSRALL